MGEKEMSKYNKQVIKLATMVCCPMCDEKLCVGWLNCEEIHKWLKNRKEGVVSEQ